MRKDVKEVIDLCRSVGLEPVMESGSGHYKVRDPKSGVYVFGISSSPSDPNFRWMIMRHLRRMGLLRERTKKSPKRGKPAIDLTALKKAQDQAASRGERIPTLDDLEDSTEFFSRINKEAFTIEAQEEAIDLMTTSENAPRVNYIRQRLRKFLEEHGDELAEKAQERLAAEGKRRSIGKGKGARAEFVRTAMREVAPERSMRAWASEASGQQTLSTFLGDEEGKLSIWAANLIEATLDHLEGLKWGVDESVKKLYAVPESTPTLPEYQELADGLEEEEAYSPAQIRVQEELHSVTENHIRERYAEALLEILKSEGSKTDEKILNRLDKLAEIV